ncbi:DUF5615 family PIN-like protein [Halovivax gelatinilyticus]|uniref:DUF5615 family PIN-like protein n=1 Tax=Halovivax gelatinilyticus TaxID=2961597 RepID=UPI003CCE44C4
MRCRTTTRTRTRWQKCGRATATSKTSCARRARNRRRRPGECGVRPAVARRTRPPDFEHTLASNGYSTVRADEQFGEATDDRRLLEWCGENGFVLCTNDRDFTTRSTEIDHAGVLIYTDQVWIRSKPSEGVDVVNLIVTECDREHLRGQVLWIDSWRDAIV